MERVPLLPCHHDSMPDIVDTEIFLYSTVPKTQCHLWLFVEYYAIVLDIAK